VWKHAVFHRTRTKEDDHGMTSDDVAAINNKRLEELTKAVNRLVKTEERRVGLEVSVTNKMELLIDQLGYVAKNLHDILELRGE
jgi:hypothetical protein